MKSSDSGKEKKLSDGAFPGNDGEIPEATADDYQPGTGPNSGGLQIPEADESEAEGIPLDQRPNVGGREEVGKPRDPGDGMS